jgi:hypothetical protein
MNRDESTLSGVPAKPADRLTHTKVGGLIYGLLVLMNGTLTSGRIGADSLRIGVGQWNRGTALAYPQVGVGQQCCDI